tara:strand:+ start:554 stop:709 length:156 start_codon:yes stop_codon:yes gene_type:complete
LIGSGHVARELFRKISFVKELALYLIANRRNLDNYYKNTENSNPEFYELEF